MIFRKKQNPISRIEELPKNTVTVKKAPKKSIVEELSISFNELGQVDLSLDESSSSDDDMMIPACGDGKTCSALWDVQASTLASPHRSWRMKIACSSPTKG